MQTKLPKAVIERAIAILDYQTEVPNTPARRTPDGKVALCGAACLAAAGYELEFSKAQANHFAKNAAETSTPSVVRQAFDRLGWCSDVCLATQVLNDSTPPLQRKRVLKEHFSQLASAV
jgi:hypothetical protein